MKKLCLKYFLLFLLFFSITFLYNFFLLNINCDEIWNYGFSYNIVNGLIPYRDFNMLQTPLFFFIGSLFIAIFGNHIYAYDIYISFIVSITSILCYKKIGKNAFLLFFVFVPHLAPSYNAFCFLLVVILFFINDSDIKYKSFWIGFIIGLIFLSKQSIGGVILLLMLLFYSNKIKSLLGFSIPCFILFIYLIYHNALYDFVNYCFLGLFDFGNSNLAINWIYTPIFLILIIVIVFQCIKGKFKDRNLIIVLGFQVIAYPVFDNNHVMLGFILYLVYLLGKYEKSISKNFKYYFIIVLTFFISWCTLPKSNYHLYDDDLSFLSMKGVFKTQSYDDAYYSGGVKKLEKYISSLADGYDNVYVFSIYNSELAYVCKIDLGYKINKFDFILNGNMGYDGEKKYISDLGRICSKESCLFLVDNTSFDSFSQTNKKIYNYPKKAYKKINELKEDDLNFSVYSNK